MKKIILIFVLLFAFVSVGSQEGAGPVHYHPSQVSQPEIIGYTYHNGEKYYVKQRIKIYQTLTKYP